MLERKKEAEAVNSVGFFTSILNKLSFQNVSIHEAIKIYYKESGTQYLEKIEELLKNGSDPNERDGSGNTPLHLLSQRLIKDNKKQKLASLLLRYKADPSMQQNEGSSALHIAALTGDTDLVELFLRYSVNVNLKDLAGQTALHLGCRCYDITQTLLMNRADINAITSKGETPLHFAVKEGNDGVVRLLLQFGANFQCYNYDGLTPLDLAQKRKLVDTEKLLTLYDPANLGGLLAYVEDKTNFCNGSFKALAKDMCAHFHKEGYKKNILINRCIQGMIFASDETKKMIGVDNIIDKISDEFCMELEDPEAPPKYYMPFF